MSSYKSLGEDCSLLLLLSVMVLQLQPLLIAAFVLSVTLIAHLRTKLRSSPNLPGPLGNRLPKALYVLFHSLYSSPSPHTNSAYRKFGQWTQEYGPVFSLRQGTENIIVIRRVQAAIDNMEREGAYTLDRPRSISAGETLSGGMRTVLTPAGDQFTKMRRCVLCVYLGFT